MKAIIFAAGRGERLRPLTDTIPKPLVKVAGDMLIARHIRRLAAMQVREIVINVSYKAALIQEALGDGSQFGVQIHYSFEPEALEVGGGIIQALPLLGDDPFLMVSADILTDFPFETLALEAGRLAHLVLVENLSWHTLGDFGLTGKLMSPKVENQKTYTYANIGIMSPRLMAGLAPGKRKFGPVLEEAASKQRITAEIFPGFWHNIGTLAQYQAAEQTMTSQKDALREATR